ncbi:flavodoxin domain-containing protein [Tessaracoccus lubricantis]
MNLVLVAYATRTASARDVAELVADVFREGGHDVRVSDLKGQPAVDGADLVVFGSGINANNWYSEATTWAASRADDLRATRVAVFNTCLSAKDPAARDQALGYNAQMVELTGAEASESFAGRYVPAKVGFFRRLLMRSMNHGEQDHLDPAAVRRWAQGLAAS